MNLPKTKYGMHCLLIDLAMALDDVYCGGQDWDVREDNLEMFVDAEEVLLRDYSGYDKDQLEGNLPEGYDNLPYKIEEVKQ